MKPVSHETAIQLDSMTGVELGELARLEAVIEHGLQTFVEVGQALLKIRDGRLYRPYPTFEEYCRERWGWSRQRSHQLIEAATVVGNLSTMVDIPLPVTERQARELSGLEPKEQREAWQLAVEQSETGQPTASEVRMAVHFSSGSKEWYTPPNVVYRVLEVLGQIDMDPCSNGGDNPNIPATVHFTKEQDGLSRKWAGRVYMNPPYGRGIDAWAEKLCSEYAGGRVSEAIALVPARVDTNWFHRFRDALICFVDGRLKFSGHENSAPFPSAVVYLGNRAEAFASKFATMGDIWIRYGR
jgi:hypothetical protein